MKSQMRKTREPAVSRYQIVSAPKIMLVKLYNLLADANILTKLMYVVNFNFESSVEFQNARVSNSIVWFFQFFNKKTFLSPAQTIYRIFSRFCIRQTQAFGGFGWLEPKWLAVREIISQNGSTAATISLAVS